MTPAGPSESAHDVIVGRHSRVGRALERHPLVAARLRGMIGHADLASFRIEPGDRVWVLSYSSRASDNSALLARLRSAPAGEVVYVSSSSTIVCARTRCYAYPRLKHRAEREARELPNGRILTLGQVYEDVSSLPAGTNMATSIDELAAFVARPEWTDDGGRARRLFTRIERPFRNAVESAAYRTYVRVQSAAGRWPCVLRPVDVVLRALGWRWYGYVLLSNRLWAATTS